MPNWKKVITSGSDAALNSLLVTNGITGSLLGTASTASFVTGSNVYGPYGSNSVISASYAANGGVTQLLAGPNITLSPTNGLGQVTVTATLSGSNSYNTSTGSYGSFYDTTTQTNPIANIARSMSFNSTDITNGVSISGSTSPFDTYIKTENAGVYDIQFSAQVDKTDGGTDDIVIWLRKNGIDLTDTATTLTLPTNNSKVVAAWNWFVSSATGDYYQIIWRSADTDLRLLAEPISGTHPGIPSVILTVNRVDQFLSNTGSFSGSFTGVFTGSLLGTASYASQALSSSYALSASHATSTAAVAGTTNYVSKFTSGTTIGDSLIYDTGTNVGIGNTLPNEKLELSVGNGVAGGLRINYASTATSEGMDITYLNTGNTVTSFDSRYNSNNAVMQFRMKTAATAVTAMTILGSGNVGIGQPTPTSLLHLFKSTFPVFTIESTSILGNMGIDTSNNFLNLGTTTNHPLVLATNNTERLRISNAGAIKFNAYGSGTFTGTATQKLAVDSSGNVIEIPIGAGPVDGSGTTNYITRWSDSDTITTSSMYETGGNIGVGTTTAPYRLTVSGKMDLNDGGSVFIGTSAGLVDDATSNNNVGIGVNVLKSNIIGDNNTAVGRNSMEFNLASGNTAIGSYSQASASLGTFNTSVGTNTLFANASGSNNVAFGSSALRNLTSGSNNAAFGTSALFTTVSGSGNTAIGVAALINTSGNENVALGRSAGRYFSTGTSINAISSGSIFIGFNSRANASGETNQIVIGNEALGLGSNTVVLGNDNIVTTALKGNVGIGTTNPSSKFHVRGESTDNVGLAYFENNHSAGGLYYPAAQFVNSYGNHSYGIVAGFKTGNASGADRPSILFYNDTAAKSWQIGQITSGWGSDDDFGIGYRASNDPNSFGAWPTNYFTITSAGNVGIGTSSPSLASTGIGLDILNSAYTQLRVRSSTDSAGIEFKPSTGDNWEVQANNSSQFFIYNRTDSEYRFLISGEGNVGIGTTTPASDSGYKSLTIDGTTGTFTEYRQSGTALFRVGVDGSRPFFYGMTNAAMDFFTNTSLKMRLTSGGSLLLGDTIVPNETAWFGTSVFGKNGTNKVITGYLASSTNGAVIGGHNSALDGWAPLNIDGTELRFNIQQSRKMTLTSGGSLLVGATSSIWETSGRGVVEVNGSSTSLIGLSIAGANSSYLYNDGTNLFLWNTLNGYMALATNNTTRMTIAAGGALRLHTYGSGTNTGTATYNLAVDSSGNVIESTPLTNPVTGTGVDNRVAIWSGTTTQDSSANLTFDGSTLGLTGALQFPQNPVGTTYGNGVSASPPYAISQGAGDSDAIKLYAESAATNQVSMVFEVNDDIETAGSEWIWRNKKTYDTYAATTPMLLSGTGNLTTIGNATFGQGANRPVTYDSSGGNFRITANAGGWSTGYLFNGSAGTYKGGFGGFGSSDSLTYFWIGDDYNAPTMILKPSQGYVGIGTTNPGYKLDVNGDISLSIGSYYKVGSTNLVNDSQYIPKATLSGIFVNSLIYEDNSKIGINTTSPSQLLHVSGRALVDQFQYTKAINYTSGDLDTLTLAGFYEGSGMTNAPNSGWFYVTIEKHADGTTQWVHQTATSFGSGNTPNEVYTRVRVGSAWGAWKQLGDAASISGTTNYVSKFTSGTAIGNSIIQDDGTYVGIGIAGSPFKLGVNGTIGAMSTLNSTLGSYSIDHPGVNTWKIGITNTNTSTLHIGNDTGGSFVNKVINITNAGDVGIGTTGPSTRLHVVKGSQSNTVSIANAAAYFVGSDIGLIVGQDNGGGGYGTWIQSTRADNIAYSLSINPNGGNVAIGTLDPGSYKLNVNGNTNVTGTFTATVKSFIIDHPTKEGKKLQYGVLEGPEHSVYVRGKLTNTNVIQLPDHWHALVHEDSITVNLTAIGKPQEIWVEEITDTYITVGSLAENVNCFYTVFAERKDIDKLVTEFDKE